MFRDPCAFTGVRTHDLSIWPHAALCCGAEVVGLISFRGSLNQLLSTSLGLGVAATYMMALDEATSIGDYFRYTLEHKDEMSKVRELIAASSCIVLSEMRDTMRLFAPFSILQVRTSSLHASHP